MDMKHIAALREQRKAVVALIDEQKAILQQIDDHFAQALGGEMRRMMTAAGKASGDVTWTLPDGTKFKGSISKTVKYDSDKLREIAGTMPWDKAQQIFKIELSVPEANYQAAQKLDPKLADRIADARTVRFGDIKIIPIE